MSGYAFFVSQNTDNRGINLFIYIGVLFIAYGVFRLLTSFVTTSKPTSIDSKVIIRCPKCQTKHYSTSNYCHMCGTKLK